ncbi:hypothetical protein HYS95_00835 [Candidatus Daviesbacteria bacterium]|nr:hypothetical protein [Candidatus Daviesbacteria bacterium]
MKAYVIPNALAVTTAIVYVACLILVALFPDASFAVARSWFHGIELTKTAALEITASSVITGLISSGVTAWVIGWIFMRVYKLLQA